MKRRSFFEAGGGALAAALIAKFGFSRDQATKVSAAQTLAQRKEMILKLLIQQGKTESEAKTLLADMEANLSTARGKCICRSCPTYGHREKEVAFCHAFVGPAKAIKEEKGCICETCPFHQEMKLNYTYYCTRKSELEQQAASRK